MDYNIEFCGGYFYCRTSGKAEVEKFGVIFDDIFGDEDWRSGLSYIMDHSDLDVSNFTIEDVQQIANIAKSKRTTASVARSAIVAPRDLEFGMSRMWSVYVDDEDNVATAVFRTQDEAIAWVSA